MDNFMWINDEGNSDQGDYSRICEYLSGKDIVRFKRWHKKAEVGDLLDTYCSMVIKLKPKTLTFGNIAENQLFIYDGAIHQKLNVFKLNKELCKENDKRVNAIDTDRQLYFFEDDEQVEPYET